MRSAIVEADRQALGGGARLAAEDEALLDLVGLQREVLVHHHLAAQHLGAAGTAHAGLARERAGRGRRRVRRRAHARRRRCAAHAPCRRARWSARCPWRPACLCGRVGIGLDLGGLRRAGGEALGVRGFPARRRRAAPARSPRSSPQGPQMKTSSMLPTGSRVSMMACTLAPSMRLAADRPPAPGGTGYGSASGGRDSGPSGPAGLR